MTGIFSEKLTSDAIIYLDYREIRAARSINQSITMSMIVETTLRKIGKLQWSIRTGRSTVQRAPHLS
jgi:hypothetical protein